MHESERFLAADLHHEDVVSTLEQALLGPCALTDEIARGGWFCQFYCRLSPADIHYLETTLYLDIAGRRPEDNLLAVALEYAPQIALFLFEVDSSGLHEIVLMPWDGATISAAAVLEAAQEVLFGVVTAIGWNPRRELRRFADEL
jgi:hypothetical protein